MKRWMTVVAVGLGLAMVAQAGEKKKAPPKEEPPPSLFEGMGDTTGSGKGGLDDLKHAAGGVSGGGDKKADENLGVKQDVQSGDGKVVVKKVFAAPSIKFEKGKCVAKPVRVEKFDAPEFPFEADGFAVCAIMEGGAGRGMRMSVKVTTGRGKVVGSAESIADFGGKKALEHAIDFPPMSFPEAGVYRYLVEIEGERVANLPLFEVRQKADEEEPQ